MAAADHPSPVEISPTSIDAQPPQWFRHEGMLHAMVWDMAIDRGFTTFAAFTRSRWAWVWSLPAAAPSADDIFSKGYE